MNSKEMFSFSPSHTKSVALVKLSTEALQCIEEYARIGASAGFKPTIQIKDGQGVLSIPGMDGVESFSFSLSDVDGNGSPSCLQCVEKPQNGEMTSLGNIETKIQIHAKTSSIAHTKSKIEADDEKQKKSGAKVFKSASTSQATSSQVEQTSQAESSAPRERKKAVPLLKKLLSRNFLKGLRSGNTSISRMVPNSAPQRAAVLLTEPPPIINRKEQKIMEMNKKRMVEDSTGEAYSDPRGKKQRISHCSQSEPSPINKINPIINITKSENVTSDRANKTQSQETRKQRLQLPIDKASGSRTPHAVSTIKSEKRLSVNAINSLCQESKRGISLCNQIKSEPGIKVDCNAAPTVQQSSSKSKAVVVKGGDKKTEEAKRLKKRLKNRRKRRKQKQNKRTLKQAARKEASASRTPPVPESQSHKNTLSEILAVAFKTKTPTNITNLTLPKNTPSETSFSIHSSETPAAVAKMQKPNDTLTGTSATVAKTQKPNDTLTGTSATVAKTQKPDTLSETSIAVTKTQKPGDTPSETPLVVAKNQKPNVILSVIPLVVAKTQKPNNNTLTGTSAAVTKTPKPDETPVAISKTQKPDDISSGTSVAVAKTQKPDDTMNGPPTTVTKTQKPGDTLSGTLAAVSKSQKPENTWSEIPVAIVKTQELKELCKRIEQPIVKTEKQKLLKLKRQHEFTLDATESCKKKLKVAQDNRNDLPFVNKVNKGFIISNLDSSSTKLNSSNLQDSNFKQKETKSEGAVKEQSELSKTSTKSLDCLDASVLDILPAKSTKSEVQLPDLVQHCERIIITAPSDNEDNIIPSLTNEQMEMLSKDSETGTNPHHSSSKIPRTSQSSSKDSILCSNKCKSRNRAFNQPCCNYGCDVTSTTRTQTPLLPYSAPSSNGAAIVSLTPTKTAIPVETERFEEITTLDQRETYKTIFTEKFDEYEKLQEDLSIYDKYLQSLAHTRKAYAKGSADYNKLKDKFYESFDYHKRRTQEYAALHSQLEHIKELVMRFDSKFLSGT